MKKVILASLLATGAMLISPAMAAQPASSAAAAAPAAPAPTPAPSSAAAYSSSTTPLGDLLDNPATKAVLQKHMPDLVSNPNIEMGRAMTLRTLQSYAGELLTDEKIAAVDADLAKIAN